MTTRRVSGALMAAAFGAGLLAMAGLGHAAEKSAAEKAYDEQVDKCQQIGNTDERQQCLDQAMKEYMAAKQKEK
jgi:hypothetical protein